MRLLESILADLSVSLLAARDPAARARIIANAVAEQFPDSTCIIYKISPTDKPLEPLAAAGDSSLSGVEAPAFAAILQDFAGSRPAVLLSGASLRREDFAHLTVNRPVVSLGYLALRSSGEFSAEDPESLIGVLEIASFHSVLSADDLESLEPIARLAAAALHSADQLEHERRDSLHSIHRMSQLYDLEKSLNATLELREVSALAPQKIRPMLNCQAIHLWLFDGEILRLMASSGEDATVTPEMSIRTGESYVADMAEEGEVLLIDNPGDERLARRNARLGTSPATPPLTNTLLVPLLQDEVEVGVLEAINKSGGRPFDDDDTFFLSTMAETVSSALKNATLMHAERKLEILETLVHVSSEITSTLRLDRLLQIIVNNPQTVLPYDRCSIALDNRGALQLKAVSGRQSLPLGDIQVDQLNDLLRWLALQPNVLYLKWREGEQREFELPRVVRHHFEVTGNCAIYSYPLNDDQGRVGLLLYEAVNPDFLDLPHIEMIKILAGQATVAIRNALLYREVPLISLLEPLAQRKRALFRNQRSRRIVYSGAAALTLLFLLFFPLPMRIKGHAVVDPLHTVNIQAPLDGNVSAVDVREGQSVEAGQPLGALNDWQWRADLTSAEARYRAAQLTMEQDLASGSARAGADRMQTDLMRAQLEQVQRHLQDAQMRSPITGVVTTPNLQNAVGQHLDAGANFAQVLDLSSAVVDIAVAQGDVRFVAPSQRAGIKLDSFPQRVWHGSVQIVSPEAELLNGDRVFVARVPLENNRALLRAGMSGDAKIFVGYRPAGYVLLRKPFFWIWHTLWDWIGW
ncbi:MAG TPA: efflux RND transporter periplasmic adaptor subunit [Terracidiphilus sp.]|nr:efflux RND transporter periplasmic adaptor subunit [Terracidiphilus sp.]